MKRSHRFLLAAAVLTAGLSTSVAWSFPHGRGGGFRLAHAVESLDLDAETTARIDAVVDAARPASRDLGRTLRAKGEALRALLADPAATEAAVVAQVEAIGALQTEMRKQDLHTLFQVRALLDADQKQQLAEAMKGKRGRHGKHCEDKGR